MKCEKFLWCGTGMASVLIKTVEYAEKSEIIARRGFQSTKILNKQTCKVENFFNDL